MPSYNRRSRLITQGIARAPNRAMLRAVGFGDADFDKPIVGVANGHSTMNPCNAGIEPLATRAVAALEEAGVKPQLFGFPTVTDGIGMGREYNRNRTGCALRRLNHGRGYCKDHIDIAANQIGRKVGELF